MAQIERFRLPSRSFDFVDVPCSFESGRYPRRGGLIDNSVMVIADWRDPHIE